MTNKRLWKDEYFVQTENLLFNFNLLNPSDLMYLSSPNPDLSKTVRLINKLTNKKFDQLPAHTILSGMSEFGVALGVYAKLLDEVQRNSTAPQDDAADITTRNILGQINLGGKE